MEYILLFQKRILFSIFKFSDTFRDLETHLHTIDKLYISIDNQVNYQEQIIIKIAIEGTRRE